VAAAESRAFSKAPGQVGAMSLREPACGREVRGQRIETGKFFEQLPERYVHRTTFLMRWRPALTATNRVRFPETAPTQFN